MELPQLSPAAPGCTRCALSGGGLRSPGIPSRWLPSSLPPGGETPTLLVLGMHPGAEDDAAGECWRGRAGRVMEESYLRGSGATSEFTIYLANAARCWTPAGRPPSPHEYRCCWQWHGAAETVAIAKAHARARMLCVLCAGDHPLRQFTQWTGRRLKMQEAFAAQGHERMVPGTQRAVRVHCTYHPSACLRAPGKINAVADHMRVLVDAVRGEGPMRDPPRLVRASKEWRTS